MLHEKFTRLLGRHTVEVLVFFVLVRLLILDVLGRQQLLGPPRLDDELIAVVCELSPVEAISHHICRLSAVQIYQSQATGLTRRPPEHGATQQEEWHDLLRFDLEPLLPQLVLLPLQDLAAVDAVRIEDDADLDDQLLLDDAVVKLPHHETGLAREG